jgi:hypothetical protein
MIVCLISYGLSAIGVDLPGVLHVDCSVLRRCAVALRGGLGALLHYGIQHASRSLPILVQVDSLSVYEANACRIVVVEDCLEVFHADAEFGKEDDLWHRVPDWKEEFLRQPPD